ncbi:hypothetical protein [Sphingomonas sp. URHD0057]|uniref:hypothetical protein n=1 Tax=Sphingomonas sp. URHD0057 TaxID=1380389 RepID=UPI00048F4D09|nr:hypothetical protein [Sphingomonas sp. URHD0057]
MELTEDLRRQIIEQNEQAGKELSYGLSETLLRKIGECILLWNKIEFEVEAAVAVLLMPLSIVATGKLMKSYNSQLKFDALQAVLDAQGWVGGTTRKFVEDTLRKIRPLADQRNEIAHGRWQIGDAAGPRSSREFYAAKGIGEADVDKILTKMRSAYARIGAARSFLTIERRANSPPK